MGYQQSEKEIPDADVVVFVKWKEGDQSARIQKAIDFVSARKMDKKTGLRGAVLLDKGVFELSQPLRIQTSGVVLRGTDRNQTVLYKKGVDRGAVVYLESEKQMQMLGEPMKLSAPWKLGERKVTLPAGCKMGDEILIVRPSTKEWIQKMGCADFGAGKDLGYWGWHPGEIDVRWTRSVVSDGKGGLQLDAPLSCRSVRMMRNASFSASPVMTGA